MRAVSWSLDISDASRCPMRGEFSQLHRGQYRGRQPVRGESPQFHVVSTAGESHLTAHLAFQRQHQSISFSFHQRTFSR